MRLRILGPVVVSNTSTVVGSPWRLLAALAFALGLSACGGETATAYSAENQEAFLAACVDGSVDGVYQQRVCLCVYDEAQETIPFERFREINEALADVENAILPDDLLDVVAGCVIEEGDL